MNCKRSRTGLGRCVRLEKQGVGLGKMAADDRRCPIAVARSPLQDKIAVARSPLKIAV